MGSSKKLLNEFSSKGWSGSGLNSLVRLESCLGLTFLNHPVQELYVTFYVEEMLRI